MKFEIRIKDIPHNYKNRKKIDLMFWKTCKTIKRNN